MKITWREKSIGESEDVLFLGSECYLPLSSIDTRYLSENTEVYHCPDKGYAVCYDIVFGDERERSGAWAYPHPYPNASALIGRIGFKKTKMTE